MSDSAPKCQSRDYASVLSAAVPALKAVYQPRFTNNTQLSLTVLHEYVSGANFKAGQYVVTAPGENPLGIEYLGMGDSFASGQGAFNYIEGTDTAINACHLSSLAYPYLLSSELFNSGRSVACSGAKTRDISYMALEYEGQVKDGLKKEDRKNLSSIFSNFSPGYLVQNDFVDKYNPQSLTLSIGGNDIGFADIVKQCVMPGLMNTTCYSTYEDQQELLARIYAIGDKLKNTYRTVSSPGRRVYVIGYPQLVVAGGNCAANVHLDEQEIRFFIGLTDVLNGVIKRAADSAGVR